MSIVVCVVGYFAFRVLQESETQIGMVVVFAVSALVTLLTVTVIIFDRLKLTNAKQALGFPEGSIRALIALFLVIIFIIMGVYLFRTVAEGMVTQLTNLTADQVVQLGDHVIDVIQNELERLMLRYELAQHRLQSNWHYSWLYYIERQSLRSRFFLLWQLHCFAGQDQTPPHLNTFSLS
ncbi:MAG: hypothetical protein H6644_09885 [Caldilineaceae bacterium]|nr:hypothetical protein [Caldilineaceae bacterium]